MAPRMQDATACPPGGHASGTTAPGRARDELMTAIRALPATEDVATLDLIITMREADGVVPTTLKEVSRVTVGRDDSGTGQHQAGHAKPSLP